MGCSSDGAASGSNLPSFGLRRRTGLKDMLVYGAMSNRQRDCALSYSVPRLLSI